MWWWRFLYFRSSEDSSEEEITCHFSIVFTSHFFLIDIDYRFRITKLLLIFLMVSATLDWWSSANKLSHLLKQPYFSKLCMKLPSFKPAWKFLLVFIQKHYIFKVFLIGPSARVVGVWGRGLLELDSLIAFLNIVAKCFTHSIIITRTLGLLGYNPILLSYGVTYHNWSVICTLQG